jgi:hypothetical protein
MNFFLKKVQNNRGNLKFSQYTARLGKPGRVKKKTPLLVAFFTYLLSLLNS